MGMGVHAAGTAAGWGQGLPGGPQLPPHHATTVSAPPGVQAAPPPPPPPAQMMAYPMQQFQVIEWLDQLSFSWFDFLCVCVYRRVHVRYGINTLCCKVVRKILEALFYRLPMHTFGIFAY